LGHSDGAREVLAAAMKKDDARGNGDERKLKLPGVDVVT
jgi:hypothetical protein